MVYKLLIKALYPLLILFLVVTPTAATAQKSQPINDVAKANQVLDILLPDNNYVINDLGISDKEIGSLLMDFAVNIELNKPVMTLDEEALYFTLCCTTMGVHFDEDEEIVNKYYTEKHVLTPSQLPIAKELKILLDKIVSAY